MHKRSLATILDAAKELSVKEADTEEFIKRWLRGAGDREGGRKSRELKKKGVLKQKFLHSI